MTRLERYTRRVLRSRGIEHQVELENLRRYLRETDDDALCAEIELLDEPNLLRILQEAGVRKGIWDCYHEKLKEVF